MAKSSSKSRTSKAKAAKKSPKQPSEASPVEVLAVGDPGDATERNYRYQHAYGVIVLIAAKRGEKPYIALWCEHHEDLLGERKDGRFDGYQIKTSRPELGAWSMRDLELVKTIGRFVDLVNQFGDRIGNLYFVSNTEVDRVTEESNNDRRRGACPLLFLDHVRDCPAPSSLAPPFGSIFTELQASCGCEPELLLSVLKRMDVILGPPREGFEAVIAHEHLPLLAGCEQLNSVQLDKLRDELIAKVWRASSLQVVDPLRHLRPLIDGTEYEDPVLAAKRIELSKVSFQPGSTAANAFEFLGPPTLAPGHKNMSNTREKLEHGDVDPEQIELMEERERAAESHLIADTHRRPEAYPSLLRQLEAMVLGECREAYLRSSRNSDSFGTKMLIEVQDRLRQLAKERPHMVGGHEYECLVGVASMLTGECRVWWSKRFPLGEGRA